jgi:hypothetical protein
VDNLYSAITDDRRLLGRKGDWDENSEEYKQWQKDLNTRGWETYLDKDNYYKLRRIANPGPLNEQNKKSTGRITAGGMDNEEKPNLLQNLGNRLKNAAPDILDALRLGLNLNNNQRVFDTMMNSIKPAL